MIFLFHHTLQKKRKWGWEWRKRDSGGVGKAGSGLGWRGRTRKQNKTGRKSISLPLGWSVGRVAWGKGPGSSVQRDCPPAHTHTPRICTVQTPDNYNSQRGEEERGSGVGSEVGKARKGHKDKISHIYNFYISINLAPAGCMCIGEGTEGELSIQKKEGWSLRRVSILNARKDEGGKAG